MSYKSAVRSSAMEEENTRGVEFYPAGAVKTKTLYLIRHGRTEMNDHLSKNDWSKKGFVDPGLYDTRLTALGRRQAKALGPVTAALDPQPQVLIASPLSRALMTAELAFAFYDG